MEYGLNETPLSTPVTPVDTVYWVAVYTDKSFDVEGEGREFPDLPFKSIEHFTMLPKKGAPHNIAICIKKPRKGYRLIWRKQRHVTTTGQYKGSDYLLGLEPDDKTQRTLMRDIERGCRNVNDISKKSVDGFRIWLTKEHEIHTAGVLSKTEEIKTLEDGDKVRYITCELLK